MVINRRLLSLIKRRKTQVIGCVILCMLSVAFLVVCTSAGAALKGTLNEFISSAKAEDAEFITAQKIDDIAAIEEKYDVKLEVMSYYDHDYNDTTLRVLKNTEKINGYQVKKGEDITASNDILINDFYAENNSLSIGDTIEINNETYKITGYFTRVDYLTPVKETSESVMGDNFGIALVSNEGFEKIGSSSEYYSILYNTDNDIDVRKFLNDEFVLMSYTPRQTNNRIMQAPIQADAVTGMAYMYGPILFVLTIVFVTLILWKILKSEKKEIGILSAIGYSRRELGVFYAKFALLISVVGALFGVVVGQLLARPICEFYAAINNCPNIETSSLFNIEYLVISFILPIVLLWITARVVVSKYLKKNVVDLIRNSGEAKSKNIRILNSKKLSGSLKYSVRNTIRNKGRTFVFILGVFIASAVVLMGMIMRTSSIYCLDVELKKGFDYDYMYYLNAYYDDTIDDGDGIVSLSLEHKETGSIVSLMGVPTESEFFKFETMEGSAPEFEDGFYVSRVLAEILGIEKGDEINFINPITTEEKKIKVDGIINLNRLKTVYGSIENVNLLMGNENTSSYNAILSNSELAIDENKVIQTVESDDFVKSLETTFNETVLSVVYVLMLLGVVVGFIIMYLITSMTIEENINNISMLKVLGYTNKEISRMMFRTNKYFVVIFYLLAIYPMVKMCEADFIAQAEAFNMIIPSKLSVLDVVIGIIAMLISYYLALFVTRKKLYNVDMVESLKQNRE